MKTMKLLLSLLLAWTACSPIMAGGKASFLKKQFTTPNGYQLNYRVLYPLDYEAGRVYPVILFLHGMGERGNNNEAQLKHGGDFLASYKNRTDYPAIIIMPQCPGDDLWVQYKRNTGSRTFTATPATKTAKAVKQLLDSYITKGLADCKQIYITGISMGGMGTFDFITRYPSFFAAAMPICGAANLDNLKRIKTKTAVRILHGGEDTVVIPQHSRDAYSALKEAGVDVIYKEYPGVGHNSWDNAFAEPDYMSWLFKYSL